VNKIVYREIDYESIENLTNLFNNVFSENFNTNDWLKKHRYSPQGKTIFIGAYDGEKLIGMNGFMPAIYIKDSLKFKAAQSCESAVHHDYRGQGIFVKLISEGHKVLKKNNYDFVFGYPNNNSLPGFEKVGWKKVGKLYHQSIPLNTHNYFFKRNCRTIALVGSVFDFQVQFWLKLMYFYYKYKEVQLIKNSKLGFNINEHDYNWRIITGGAEGIYVNNSRGDKVHLLLKQHTTHGGSIIYDKKIDNNSNLDYFSAINALIYIKKNKKWNYAQLWSTEDSKINLPGLGFRRRNESIFLLAYPLSEEGKQLLKDWILKVDPFDMDTYLVPMR
jgi:hypothetical protein